MRAFDLVVNLRVDFGKVSSAARDALETAIVDNTVNYDIKPLVVELSPWLTGTNRRSIDPETVKDEKGIGVLLFTTSGYGGYLGAGTCKMAARPYLYPAFLFYRKTFFRRLRDILKAFRGGAK